MHIDHVVIERADGPLYCGILFYEHDAANLYLPWTVDLNNPRQVVLKLFLPEEQENPAVVHDHYEVMADAIVDCVMKRTH